MEHWQNTSLENLTEVIDEILYVEEWRTIKDFPDYMVSNFGRLKTLKRGRGVSIADFILKQPLTPYGYLGIGLYVNGKVKRHHVHRLVCAAFTPNRENKATVNHKNGIKTDNRLKNLEWATSYEQMAHVTEVLNKNIKPVLCITNGVEYKSIRIAASSLGVDFSAITKICKKKKKSAKGYIFMYI